MIAWWESLSAVSHVFACIAIPATVVLLIQTILMLIGIGTETADGLDTPDVELDTDVELDGTDGVFGDGVLESDPDPLGFDGLRVFTVRGIIAFLVVFGWVGVMMDSAGSSLWLSLPIAAICGFAMMLLLAFLMRTVMRLRSDGNLDNHNALGVAGKVYLTVPAARAGEGKVNILLQGSYVERGAVTDEETPIPTGSEIVVTGLSGQTTLVVKRK
ncbi:MAG: NfeD family protein [Clostridia bacterium]|nr:NfeD family protein [Clostridia bacterium]